MQPQSDHNSEQNYWHPSSDDQQEDTSFTAPPKNEGDELAETELPLDAPLVEWESPEFIHHDKTPLWYVVFGFTGLAVLGIAIFVLKDWFVTLGFLVTVVVIGVFAQRKPRMLRYALDHHGLHIGEKFYSFAKFHAFGVVQEGTVYSIALMPNARFDPMVTVYFPQDLGEQIVDVFSQHLPMQELKLEWIDKVTRKIRF